VRERELAAARDAGDLPLARLAAELDVADAVRFTGNVPDADLAALYNCGIAYLGLSRRSGRTGCR